MLRKSDAARNKASRSLVDNTRGVLFLATPHAGAKWATVLKAFKDIFGATVTVEELRADNVQLHDMNDWYQTKAPEHGIRTKTYYESRAVRGVAKIVHRASANPGVGDNPVALDEDHLSIAKPRDREAQVCAAARRLVELALSPALAEEGPAPPDPQPQEPERLMDGPVDFWALPAAQRLCNRLAAAYGADNNRVRRLVAASDTPTDRIAFQGVPASEVWSAAVETAYNGETLCALLQQVLDDRAVRAHHDAVRSLGREFGCAL